MEQSINMYKYISAFLLMLLVIAVIRVQSLVDKIEQVEFQRDVATSKIQHGEDRLDVILKDKIKKRIIVCSR